MNRAGEAIAQAMTEAHGQVYQWGQTRDLLYPSAGTSKDWIVEEHGVPLSWTWELRDDGEKYGYLIPPDQIFDTYDEVIAGMDLRTFSQDFFTPTLFITLGLVFLTKQIHNHRPQSTCQVYQ